MKPRISLVVAIDNKNGIGKEGKIPWHIREDLIHLRELIKGHVVILGRKTFDTIVFYYNRSGREMPARLYIIVTRNNNYVPARPHGVVVRSIDEALELAKKETLRQTQGLQEIFIIGGQQIFEQTLPLVDKLYLTVVEGDYNCDTFFPDYAEFKKIVSEKTGESEGHKYKFLELEK
ncbi:dihydrofolate reductase [Candidatus Microgenomates bacterium]|nr:dihydrofolate reductase [Candidatus Microgenomates bacterium]